VLYEVYLYFTRNMYWTESISLNMGLGVGIPVIIFALVFLSWGLWVGRRKCAKSSFSPTAGSNRDDDPYAKAELGTNLQSQRQGTSY